MDNCLVVLREMAVSLLLLLSLITNIQGLEQVPTNYGEFVNLALINFVADLCMMNTSYCYTM